MVISHHTAGQWRPAAKAAGKLPQELTGSSRLPAPESSREESLEEGGRGGNLRGASQSWNVRVSRQKYLVLPLPLETVLARQPTTAAPSRVVRGGGWPANDRHRFTAVVGRVAWP